MVCLGWKAWLGTRTALTNRLDGAVGRCLAEPVEMPYDEDAVWDAADVGLLFEDAGEVEVRASMLRKHPRA